MHFKMIQIFTMVCVRLTGCANISLNSFCAFFQLEVLTNLANETNISTILREFQV